MIPYSGDFIEGATVYLMFNTFDSNDPSASCTITNFTNTDVHIHKDNGLTQRNNAAGITVSVDFDGITGSHMIAIDTSDDTVAGFWETGHDYFVRIEGTTIDAATINAVVAHFSIQNRYMRGTNGANTTTPPTVTAIRTEMDTNSVKMAPSQDLAAYKATGFSVPNEYDDAIAALQTDLDNPSQYMATGFSTHSAADVWTSGTRSLTDKAGFSLLSTGADLILKDSLFALAMADAVWDEILTGATHNIATSAGKRLRQIGAYAIHDGTAQAGATTSITLATTASTDDGIYDRNLLVIVGGTGVGQTRTIVYYDGTTKVCDMDRDWRIIPDSTSEYQIVADDTPLVVDHGVAQAGTATTITLRGFASDVDGVYVNNIITIVAGAGAGETRLVKAYDGTTKVATIYGNDWTTTPDTSSVYIMMPYGYASIDNISDDALTQIRSEMEGAGHFLDQIKDDTNDLQTNQDAWLTADITALALEASLTAMKGATFDGSTDSLESIRDRGDDAWTTGAGGSAPTVEEIRTEMDTNSVKMAPSQSLADYKADVTNLDVAVSSRNATTPPTTAEIKTAIEAAGSSIASILEDTNDLQTNQDAWLTADITALALEASLTAMKGATFDGSTDSLESIRDRGDDAWTTGAGGSAPTVEEIRNEMEGAGYKLATIEDNLDTHDQNMKAISFSEY